jgi:hypothetical protein
MCSDELVSCYEGPAELVLFNDVQMKGHIRGREHPLEIGQGLPGSKFVAFEKSGHCRLSKSKNTLLM